MTKLMSPQEPSERDLPSSQTLAEDEEENVYPLNYDSSQATVTSDGKG